MASRQQIDIAVNTGSSSGDLSKTSGAAEGLEGSLDRVAASADAASAAVSGVGDEAQKALPDLANLADLFNDFLARRAQAAGKPVRLFDLDEDKEALLALRAAFEGLVKDTKGSGLGQKLALSGQHVSSPEQVRFDKLDSNLKAQNHSRDQMILSLLRRTQGAGPSLNLGLTASELQGKAQVPPTPAQVPGAQALPHAGRRPRRSADGDEDDARRPVGGVARAGQYLMTRLTAGSGQAGQLVGEAARGAGGGLLGRMPGGLLGGLGIGIAGYGLFKGAQAVGEGMDRAKNESQEIDLLRRATGGLGDGFDNLRERTRQISNGFSLTYDQSRKLAVEFARISLYADKANARNVDAQTREAIGMAQAVGVDESEGVRAMASLRHDRTLGDSQRDARMFGVQVAEALKRSGSTLNASDLLQAVTSFSHDVASRSLSEANASGYMAMLSAMAGSGTAGLDTRNAAAILAKADAAFSSGGRMGEASQTLQYMGLGGDKLGPALTYARQEAGMFGTTDSTLGGKNNQLRIYLESKGVDLSHARGSETGLESMMKMFDANVADPQARLLAMRNHTGLSMQQTAALYNMREAGNLTQTADMASGAGVDLSKVSAAGYEKLAELAVRRNTPEEMHGFRSELLSRKGLTDDQRTKLQGLAGESDPERLRTGLAQVVATLEREKNQGQEIQEATAKTSNATQRMADLLIPATLASRDFLGALVSKLAPDSKEARALAKQAKQEATFGVREQAEAGKLSPEELDKRNKDYDAASMWVALETQDAKPAEREKRLAEVERQRREELGSKAVPAQPVRLSVGHAPVSLGSSALGGAQAAADAGYTRFLAERAAREGTAMPEEPGKPPTGPGNAPAGQNSAPAAPAKPGTAGVPVDPGRLMPEISKVEAEMKLPPGALAALVAQESGFDPQARGKEVGADGKTYQSSAYGLTQITDATWKALAPRFHARYSRDPDRNQPGDQLRMGGMYLHDGLEAEGGDLRRANAFYHGGAGWRKNGKHQGETVEAHLQHADRVMARVPQYAQRQAVAAATEQAAAAPKSPPPAAVVAATPPAKDAPEPGKAAVATATKPKPTAPPAKDAPEPGSRPEAVAAAAPKPGAAAPKPKAAEAAEVDPTAPKYAKTPIAEPADDPAKYAKRPDGDPVARQAENKAADERRVRLEFAPMAWEARVNVAGLPGGAAGAMQSQQVAVSGVVAKPRASGNLNEGAW